MSVSAARTGDDLLNHGSDELCEVAASEAGDFTRDRRPPRPTVPASSSPHLARIEGVRTWKVEALTNTRCG